MFSPVVFNYQNQASTSYQNSCKISNVYKFYGENKQQTKGGAIGFEMTGEMAEVFKLWWVRKINSKLEENTIKVKLNKR